MQYCINTCSAVDAAQCKIRYLQAHGRRSAATKDFLEEKAGQTRDIDPLAGQVLGKMIASGWQTAPPQIADFEVVLVTNSACQQLLEASPRVPDLPGFAPFAFSRKAFAAELDLHLIPAIDFCSRASASPILSAPR